MSSSAVGKEQEEGGGDGQGPEQEQPRGFGRRRACRPGGAANSTAAAAGGPGRADRPGGAAGGAPGSTTATSLGGSAAPARSAAAGLLFISAVADQVGVSLEVLLGPATLAAAQSRSYSARTMPDRPAAGTVPQDQQSRPGQQRERGEPSRLAPQASLPADCPPRSSFVPGAIDAFVPNRSSMRRSWLYLQTRSVRQRSRS